MRKVIKSVLGLVSVLFLSFALKSTACAADNVTISTSQASFSSGRYYTQGGLDNSNFWYAEWENNSEIQINSAGSIVVDSSSQVTIDGLRAIFLRSTTDTNYGVTYYFFGVPAGSSSSSGSLTPEQSYMKSTERFANEIADASALAASTKKNVKLEYSTGSALPMNIMRAMTESKNVTLEYTFEFLGYKFKTTITPETAQKAFKEDIPWHGPYYLASNFKTVVVGPVE